MKHRIFVLVILISILISLPVYAAPTVDGFVGVPWGASSEQIDQTMQEKGFSLSSASSTMRSYNGIFAGEARVLKFRLSNNKFYEGYVCLGTANNNTGVQRLANEWTYKLNEKYGQLQKRRSLKSDNWRPVKELRPNSYGRILYWGVKDAASADNVQILLQVNWINYNRDRSITNGEVDLIYRNASLEKRLAEQEY
ncbi:MAG: hypothetical protein H6Q73_1395 [Firmicutes bacterium]|nr:hypothetical protein [Bacillota bacterium]